VTGRRRPVNALLVLALLLAPATAGAQQAPDAAPYLVQAPDTAPYLIEPPPPSAASWLDALAEEHWRHPLDRDPGLRLQEGLPVTELPGVTRADAEAEAHFAQGLLERLAAVDPEVFHEVGDHERWLTYKILQWQARQTVDALPHFRQFFQVTPYSSGYGDVLEVFGQVPLATDEDRARHLDLLRQLADRVGAVRANLLAQRELGILLPKPEIPLVERTYAAMTVPAAEHPLRVTPERLAGLDPATAEAHATRAEELLSGALIPAIRALLDGLDDDYRAAAPDGVGLGQYPGGPEAYRYLVGLHTTRTDLAPRQLHERGLAEVERIGAEMAELRRLLGSDLPARSFHQRLLTDPRFLARDPEGVAERLMRPVRAIEPLIPDYFLVTPEAPYGVARLDPALEPAMTFGYYQEPMPGEPVGRYLFNGSSLDERPLVVAAALIYHELVPGHHFQIALQRENEALPPFRRTFFPNAFIEGWAEYASGLAGEMGLYTEPYDRYGRLAMEMFLASRLVVDTGMNALGWSREQALDFLRERVLQSETELATETLRYAVDIPGQALAYKTGALAIQDLRRRAEEALGERFDIRRFHHAVLAHGAMPLDVLDEHIEWWVERELERDEPER
jgi:uncharacterized protein (DUF885 family)